MTQELDIVQLIITIKRSFHMNNNLLEKYARFIVKAGVNIQKNQTLVISSPIECAPFARIIVRIAYEEGAKDVVVE
jgi:aminopeptidase